MKEWKVLDLVFIGFFLDLHQIILKLLSPFGKRGFRWQRALF